MAAISAGARAFRDPGIVEAAATQAEMQSAYSRAWAYYRNNSAAVYSDAYRAACLARGQAIYRHTRLIYNPVPTIVDFYVDHVFPVVPEVVDDIILVTPLSEGLDDALRAAVAQLEQWGNWQSESPRIVRYGAVTGRVMVEVDDDDEREKVVERVVWPSWIKECVTDGTGNVKSYVLEYKAWDAAAKEFYTYRKEVDEDSFRYFRNDRPFDATGAGVEVGNDYGFVPAVLVKHDDDGDASGTSAVADVTKVDEVNSLASHAHDRTHKAIEAPKAISTDGDIMAVTGADGVSKRGQSGGISTAGYDPRIDWMLLKTGAGADVLDLDAGFNPALSDPQIDRLLTSFEADYPELQARELIKNKAQIALGTLERMLSPAQRKLDRSSARYHHQYVKLRQMQMAIAGYRFNGGGWTKKDSQQQRFKDFNLNSYSAGELNFGLKRSRLVEASPLEEEELKLKRAEYANAVGERVDDLEYLMLSGYSEDRAKEIMARRRGPGSIPTEEQ